MKKRSRVKLIARWTAWALAVLLPAMWVATTWVTAFVRFPAGDVHSGAGLGLSDGALSFAHASLDDLPTSGFTAQSPPRVPPCWRVTGGSHRSLLYIAVPLWIPWACCFPFAFWFYRDHRREKRRRMTGCCPACGYSRLGLAPGAPCPECGTLPTPEAAG